ncbi:MAG: rod shape-determining protein RodA [Bdellovibrionota bacterium]
MATLGNEEVGTSKYDLNAVWMMLILIAIGIVNLYSATYASQGGEAQFWKQQTMWFVIGTVCCGFAYFVHYRVLERFAYFAYAANILLLLAVLVVGKSVLGARRWLGFGAFSIQPSEFMKITIAWTLAKFFHDDQYREYYDLKALLIPVLLIMIPVMLVMAQPDLGTALIILAVSMSMIFFVKVSPKLLLTIGIAVLTVSYPVYRFGLKDYQRQRIYSFINPQSDPRGTGYNSIQSMIAVGSGQFLGKGYKKGTQSQLNFLPEHHTDFIFPVFSEEHGFVGFLVLLVLYSTLLSNALKIAYGSNDKFGMLFAFGMGSLFFWHVFINIGMTTGIMPIVGVPLPFMSYGGSFMLACMLAVAILTNIANKKSMF